MASLAQHLETITNTNANKTWRSKTHNGSHTSLTSGSSSLQRPSTVCCLLILCKYTHKPIGSPSAKNSTPGMPSPMARPSCAGDPQRTLVSLVQNPSSQLLLR